MIVERQRAVWWTLVAILGLAYGLRIVGLSHGQPSRAGLSDEQAIGNLSPYAPVHPDEYDYVSRPLYMLLRGVRNPEFFHNPAFFIYINYGQFWLSGLGNQYDHESGIGLREYTPFHVYPQGRMPSVLVGVLGVALVFLATRRSYGLMAAVIAALLVAVSFIYTQHGHYGKSSELSGAMVAGAIGFSLRLLYLRDPGYLAYVIPGIFVGLAGGSRYNDALVGLVYVACAGVVFLRKGTWKPAIVGGLMMPLTFLGTNPYVIRDFDNFYAQFTFITTLYRTYDGPYAAYFPFSLFAEYRYFFFFGLGPLGFLVALWGIVVAFIRRPAWRGFLKTNSPALVTAILLVYVAVYSAISLTPRNLGEQLLVPMVPVFAMLAGYGFQNLAERFKNAAVRRNALLGGTVLLIAWPLWISAHFSVQLAQPDTRDIAAQWILENIPEDTAVHLLGPYNVPLDSGVYLYTFNVACSSAVEDCPTLEEIHDLGAEVVIYSDAWFHDWFRSAEFVDPAFLADLRVYVDRIEDELIELARFERPVWPGWDMPMHTASYWHNPTIIIYAFAE